MAYDHGRRVRVQRVALDAFAKESEIVEPAASELKGRPCRCVSHLAAGLRADYAEALLSAVEVQGWHAIGYRGRDPELGR